MWHDCHENSSVIETFILNEEYSFHQQLTEDQSAPIGKDSEHKDLKQTKMMKLENILPNYKKENFQELMDKEWEKPVIQILPKIQKL